MMMNKKQTLKLALKTYYANKRLSDRQLELVQQMLHTQAAQTTASSCSDIITSGTAKWLGALVVSLALLVVLLSYLQTPAVITDAYADVKKDASINNGMQTSMQQWMNENQIAVVPPQYTVEMSKFCRLDQYLTTHLRISGEQQEVVHLFFHYGKSSFGWRNKSGVMDKMNWKLLKARDNLTLIVLYSHEMREKTIQHILVQMLPVSSAGAAILHNASRFPLASM